MKRFLLFAGDNYYPGGGAWDLVSDFDTLEQAQQAGMTDSSDWCHILDTDTADTHEPDVKGKWRLH